jgi:5-methylcytosine-specific restriction endonuclease McrA
MSDAAEKRVRTEEQRLRLNYMHRKLWVKRTEAQKTRRRHLAKLRYPQKYPKSRALRIKQREDNPEHIRAQRRRYYLKAKDKEALSHKAWVARNRPRMNELNARRRALRVAATINLEGIQAFVAATMAKRFVKCYYCKSRILSSTLHWDHIIPLSKGGQHSVENLCVSCPTCNLTKGAKSLLSWARGNIVQQVLNL